MEGIIDLSIIIPVYNVERYLVKCLDSIYAIRNINFEVIIVNDGSTDSSSAIIQHYCSLFPQKTIVINKENGGLSSARNAGLKEARGSYIAFIDSDDFIDSDKIVSVLTNAKEMQLDIIFGDYIYCDEKSCILLTSKRYSMNHMKAYQVYNGLEYWENALNKDQISVEACFQLYNLSFLRKYNLLFKEGIYHEDFLFSYYCIFYAKKVMYVPIAYYYYRQRPGSIMSSAELHYMKQLHKLKIINELLNFKKNHLLELYSWDTVLLATYFDVVRRGKIKNDSLCFSLNECKKITIISRLKKILLPFLGLFAKNVNI